LLNPEIHWRAECILIWYQALIARSPTSRDYVDWLEPFVKKDAFKDPTYHDFWLHDVKAETVPLNRLMGLVGDYQTDHKITHGNAQDQIHAGNLLNADLFLTADRAYHAVLGDVVTHHYPEVKCPVLLDRNAPSALEALSSAMKQFDLRAH